MHVEPELHTDLKVYSAKAGKTMSAVVEAALKEYMEKHPVK